MKHDPVPPLDSPFGAVQVVEEYRRRFEQERQRLVQVPPPRTPHAHRRRIGTARACTGGTVGTAHRQAKAKALGGGDGCGVCEQGVRRGAAGT